MMNHQPSRPIVPFVVASLIVVAGLASGWVTAAGQDNPIDDPAWMLWGADHFSAVEENGSFYLGGVGRVRQWSTDLSQSIDYTWLDGLNQQVVRAIGVSSDGERWFGGDNGLAVLDNSGHWRYYATDNSDLAENPVDAIAMTGDGSVWVSHGLPDGAVSQRAPDGSWRHFPDRASAVAQHYATILTTLQPSRLWTIRGSEVWIGYRVFDGQSWAQHGVGEPEAMVVDHTGALWVLDTGEVRRWSGQEWETFYSDDDYASVTTLASPDDQGPYIATQLKIYYFFSFDKAIGLHVFANDEFAYRGGFPRHEPAQLILTPPAHAPVVVGSNWFGWPLTQTKTTATDMAALPAGNLLGAVRMGENQEVWLFSNRPPNRTLAGLQRLADGGTARLDDDVWARWLPGDGLASIVAFDRVPDSDVWFVTYQFTQMVKGPLLEGHLFQLHAGELVSYELPELLDPITDYRTIQVVDDQRVLLAYTHTDTPPPGENQSWGNTVGLFNNGGTPQNPDDDQWQLYSFGKEHPLVTAALDTQQRMWYADETGIFRHENGAWRQISSFDAACRLVPAADGAMLALWGRPACGNIHNDIVLIEANDVERRAALADLVRSDFDLVRSAVFYNAQWTIAPDGAVWYLTSADDGHLQLHRYDSDQEYTYSTPLHTVAVVSSLDVDANNHVWIVADGYLWRLSNGIQPDFTLTVYPSSHLLMPGGVAFSTITAPTQGGLTGTITLAVEGLPAGLSAIVAPNPLSLDHSGQLTLSAEAELPAGVYSGRLIAQTASISHTAPFTVTVDPSIQYEHLPIVGK